MLQNSWPEYIDPLRLAKQKGQIKGSDLLLHCSRLAPLLYDPIGDITFLLQFDFDPAGRLVITGGIMAKLLLTCQRCLKALELPVSRQINLAVVSNLVEAAALPDTLEPVLMTENKLSVRELIEDELILALPVVARHEMTECTMNQ